MRANFLLLSCCMLFVNLSVSGAGKFTGETGAYLSELQEFMKNLSNEHDITVDAFVESWEEDSLYSEEQQKSIAALSVKLEEKNVRPYPHFVNFLKSLMIIHSSTSISDKTYEDWVKGLEFYLKRKRANVGELGRVLEFSSKFFFDGTIYSSASTQWLAKSADYSIEYKKGVRISFPSTELMCITRADSINIFEAKGYVDPSEITWIGSFGVVTWERAGYNREQMNAKLKDYTIQLKKSEYKASDVVMTNTIHFEKEIIGELHDKVKHIAKPENATYPKFFSYEESFEIENLYRDVNYSGGLSMEGAKLVGRGIKEIPAVISVFHRDTLVLEASSLYFGFKAERVVSEKTSISIKLRTDSIYHPDLFFSFRTEERELTLLKTDSYTSLGPYYNSYHNIDMNFDQLSWRLDEDFMRFTAAKGATIGNAYFESENYFNFEKFLDMQLMDEAHPLISIRSFSKHFMNEDFPIREYADYLKKPLTQVKHQVMRLAFGGFVFYDDNTEMVSIKPRLHDYLAASVNRIDYDVIGFRSRVETPINNAVFNLRNYDLTINGIPKIFVSDSQNVGIIPKNSQIILKENRDFQFDGLVIAGLLEFYGSNLFFSYDSFKIRLQKIDSVNINFQTGKLDNYGLPAIATVKNKIQNVTGEVLIDKKDNKSGRVSNPIYPIFKSKEVSYVYYQSDNIEDGVYDAQEFYFALDPFVMDSLDNFNVYAMGFEGNFVSAGILPDIQIPLVLQPDYSLGFKHATPEGGMPLYGGKGTFDNEIWLSNKGLRAAGSINYLTSTISAEDFQFYPDSMNVIAQEFKVKKQTNKTQYPRVESENSDIHWEPHNDVLFAEKIDSDFTIFTDTTSMAGTLQLEPSGLSGWGRMDLKNSDLVSDRFRYTANDIYADTSDFHLKSIRKEGFTVLTENINSHISYTERKGKFRSNEDYSLVTFPENKYISYIDQFIWDMGEKTLAMGAQTKPELPDYTIEDEEPVGPRFISTDPQQDSLNFVSPLSYYDYKANVINATGVKFIEVADARVYPNKGEVTVQSDSRIRTLENSWVRAHKETKYHHLHSATINIAGRKDYSGMANYDYIDRDGEKQLIHFDDVAVNDSGLTVAYGQIYETADFTLSPAFAYQGKVSLLSTDSLLTFDGSVQTKHFCDVLTREWVNFETRIDPKDIYIPVNNVSKSIDQNNLYSGMFVYYDSVHIYPTFFNNRKNYSDRQMLVANGFLHYDRAAKLYKIGSKEKINDFTLSEDYISFHREDCKLNGEGNIDLGQDLGMVTLKNYGTVTHTLDKNLTELNLVMAIDFFISEDMINLVGNEVDSFPGLAAANLNRPIYKKTMNAWVGEETANKVEEELNLFGTVNDLPKELKHTILLNEIKLIWSDVTNSYHSVGKIGVSSINGIQVNRKIDGYFELRIKRSGDIMDLYLQLDRKTYLYFGYTRGVMQTLSSNKVYVETIMNMKTRERKLKTSRGQTPYSFLISTDRKKNNFYRRWQDRLTGKESNEVEGVQPVDGVEY